MAVYFAIDPVRRHDPDDGTGPRRPSHARVAPQFLRTLLQGRPLRRPPGHRDDRLRPTRQTGAGMPAENDHRRRQRLPARSSISNGCGRSPTAVGALLFVDMAHIAGLVAAGIHPSPVPLRRFRHHHHAQDPARPAGGFDPVQGEIRQGHRLVGVARHPGRPADAHHRRQGGLLPRSDEARVQGLPAPDRQERAGRWPRR